MPYEQDMRKAKRQQMLAQMLMQQGQQSMQGSQGRYFVAPSRTASVLGALQQLGGVYAGAKADEQVGALDDQRKKELAAKIAEMAGVPSGNPSVSSGIVAGDRSVDPLGQMKPAQPVMGFTPPAPQQANGQRDTARNQQMAAALAAIGGLPIEQQEQILSSQAMQQLFAKPKLERVDAGGELLTIDETGNIVGRIPKTAAPSNELEKIMGEDGKPILAPRANAAGKMPYEAEPEAVRAARAFLTNPELAAVDQARKRAGASNVTVDTRQETEEAKAVGKAFGEQYTNILKSGQDANSKIDRLDRMESLMEGVETGKLTPAMTNVSAVAQSMGFELDPQLDTKQAIDALSNEMALQARNPSGGAGMPGALSDKDREFLVRITPGLGKTQGGNKMIIETSKKLAQRDQEVAKLAREYRARNGKLDEGFYETLAEFSSKNPLFGQAQESVPPPQTSIDDLVNKYDPVVP